MATFTEHYDLIKPGTDDYYDVADFNENMDAIDTQLYQAEQDMAGVSEKIGNPGDEGEDTLFGLLHPSHQPEEKADIYRYSTTEIKKNISNWSPKSTSSRFYGKLTTFRAEKNGTIYLKLKVTDSGSFAFDIYDNVPYQLSNAPEKTNMGESISCLPPEEKACLHYEYSSDGEGRTCEWVSSVTAGTDYTFLYIGYTASSAQLEEFLIGYTDTKEA